MNGPILKYQWTVVFLLCFIIVELAVVIYTIS